jgi:hypothetical protein
MVKNLFIICALVFCWVSWSLAEDLPVANIKTLKGTVALERQGRTLVPMEGERIFKNDLLKTGSDGAVGLTFKDNTLISLGSNTKLAIKEFDFSPVEGKLSFVARLFKGTVAYLSGMIAKISPEAVRFETPVGNAGIRGTKFVVRVEEND